MSGSWWMVCHILSSWIYFYGLRTAWGFIGEHHHSIITAIIFPDTDSPRNIWGKNVVYQFNNFTSEDNDSCKKHWEIVHCYCFFLYLLLTFTQIYKKIIIIIILNKKRYFLLFINFVFLFWCFNCIDNSHSTLHGWQHINTFCA